MTAILYKLVMPPGVTMYVDQSREQTWFAVVSNDERQLDIALERVKKEVERALSDLRRRGVASPEGA